MFYSWKYSRKWNLISLLSMMTYFLLSKFYFGIALLTESSFGLKNEIQALFYVSGCILSYNEYMLPMFYSWQWSRKQNLILFPSIMEYLLPSTRYFVIALLTEPSWNVKTGLQSNVLLMAIVTKVEPDIITLNYDIFSTV